MVWKRSSQRGRLFITGFPRLPLGSNDMSGSRTEPFRNLSSCVAHLIGRVNPHGLP